MIVRSGIGVAPALAAVTVTLLLPVEASACGACLDDSFQRDHWWLRPEALAAGLLVDAVLYALYRRILKLPSGALPRSVLHGALLLTGLAVIGSAFSVLAMLVGIALILGLRLVTAIVRRPRSPWLGVRLATVVAVCVPLVLRADPRQETTEWLVERSLDFSNGPFMRRWDGAPPIPNNWPERFLLEREDALVTVEAVLLGRLRPPVRLMELHQALGGEPERARTYCRTLDEAERDSTRGRALCGEPAPGDDPVAGARAE